MTTGKYERQETNLPSPYAHSHTQSLVCEHSNSILSGQTDSLHMWELTKILSTVFFPSPTALSCTEGFAPALMKPDPQHHSRGCLSKWKAPSQVCKEERYQQAACKAVMDKLHQLASL